MSVAAAERPAAPKLLLAVLLGAGVAVALGVYGKVHDPSQKLVFTLFFSSTISMKVWLATFAVGFGLIQVLSALWLYGKLPGAAAPEWLGGVHRISGRLAFLISLPVAYHCLWSLGFQDTTTRALLHSLLGCVFYGAFAAKVTIVRSKGLPGVVLPIAGGLVFALLVGAWVTSAGWFIDDNGGFPDFYMLRRVDTWLAIGTWIVAGLFVVMLVIGPEVVAEDKGTPASTYAPIGSDGGGSSVDAKQVFTSNCGSCHTLSKAGTTGSVGPNLDDVGLDAKQVEDVVRSGTGVMPAFEGKLSDAEITAVAAYVSGP